ncbi:hypothetical protein CDEST_03120 [Colletotrichum destructivum]|uniref:Uncharacterized protein n=1 Tax=Colletotrichum destructivum TaxID=34406 RepID=A0AAX4I4F9_9PEZI|nr:hypothetical protein CDEST_03120 [Colletotrichum destructivum]
MSRYDDSTLTSLELTSCPLLGTRGHLCSFPGFQKHDSEPLRMAWTSHTLPVTPLDKSSSVSPRGYSPT